MSFILDALKKSETERQQQSSAEFASVPSSSGSPNPARWLWMLGILLLVNFVVLIGILFKPSATDDDAPVESGSAQSGVGNNNFQEQVAVAIDSRTDQAAAPAARQVQEDVVTNSPATVPQAPARRSRSSIATVPTVDELRLEGTLQIAELHLDIHVFSEVPADRFVFINMNKHREGSTTPEGPVVREIRTDGVVLEYQGRVFLLPRE
jgi:general secretion pathway protein B